MLLKEAGPFIQMTETLAQQLNTDFRLKPALLPSIASLFASAIIHSPRTVIKFLTAEVSPDMLHLIFTANPVLLLQPCHKTDPTIIQTSFVERVSTQTGKD